MKLYYSPGACSLAGHIVLEWIGKPYDTQKIDIKEPRPPEFLALNPAGAVPVLEEDGWALTQNAAILNYLADVYPESGLGGDGTHRGRAEVNRWMGLANSDIHPAFKPLFGAARYLKDADAIEQTKLNARRRLRKLFEVVNAGLEGRDWIAGARSVADPYLFVLLRWARGMQVDLSGLDRLERFLRHMYADAAVKEVLHAEGLRK